MIPGWTLPSKAKPLPLEAIIGTICWVDFHFKDRQPPLLSLNDRSWHFLSQSIWLGILHTTSSDTGLCSAEWKFLTLPEWIYNMLCHSLARIPMKNILPCASFLQQAVVSRSEWGWQAGLCELLALEISSKLRKCDAVQIQCNENAVWCSTSLLADACTILWIRRRCKYTVQCGTGIQCKCHAVHIVN